MPKQRRGRSVSLERCMASPLHCSSSRSRHPNGLENEDNVREWEEARCPVCMEHPHNAILLLCSSHDKGCRPFMCDTSYRHSNCFDQFKKSFPKDSETTEQVTISASDSLFSEATILNTSGGRNEEGSLDEEKPNLVCPLCRGEINGWIIVDSARRFMDAKARSCACETCEFSGTYSDLRTHARTVHPSVRPTEADPERQRNWNRLERRRDLGDLLSSMQSPLVVENTEETPPEFDEGNWLTVFFLVRVFRAGSNSRSSDQSVLLRSRPTPTTRRRSIRLLMESTSEEVQSRDVGELLESSTRSNGRSNNSSATSVVNLGRRPRRQRDESSDGEAHYSSSDGGPGPRRMFTRSMTRQRRRRSPEN